MNYVLINENGEVMQVSSTEIIDYNPAFKVIKNVGKFTEGDELKHYIVVNKVDEDDECISYSAVRQTPLVANMLRENAELRQADAENKQAIADLTITLAAVMSGGAQ